MSIRAICPFCDSVSRYSGEWRGRRLHCGNPQCGRYFVAEHVIEDAPKQAAERPARVQPPPDRPQGGWAKPVEPHSRARPVEPPLARPIEAPLARPVAVPLAIPVPTRPCLRCGMAVPEDAVLCTACGTNLETGRRLVAAKPWDKEEEREQLHSGWLRLVSLWMPGLFPYASEAPLHRAPLALVVLLIAIVVCYPIGRLDWTVIHFATWAGDPAQPRVIPRDESEGGPIEIPVGKFAWYQPVTSQFLHGDIEHLIFNLVVLLVFGPKVNDLLGNWGFALAYLGIGAVADVAHLYVGRGQPPSAGLGASGAIMVVAGMYAIFCPQHRVRIVAWFRSYTLGYIFLVFVIGLVISLALDGAMDEAVAGLFVLLAIFLLFILTVVTIIALLVKISDHPAAHIVVGLLCWPFRVRGLWLVLFFFGLDVCSILLGSEDNVGHGVHILGFVSGAAVAAMLVATRAVRCGGHDLLTWCYGQEDMAGDLAAEDREAEEWAMLANRPGFFAAMAVAGVVGFLFFLVSVVERIIRITAP